jgi:very-short-patch-repair endonuclease
MKRLGRETAKPGLWPTLSKASQHMRTQPTPAEAALWQRVRGSALGVRFRRQHAIDRFVVDLVCLKARLVVEVDGDVHRGREGEDAERDAVLSSLGYRVLRFTNGRVLTEADAVVAEIQAALPAAPLGTDSP